jgi:predicted alpha/beta-hydrolase family hydrolase
MPTTETFAVNSVDPPVRGSLHRPEKPNHDGLVFTHGAGGNAKGAMLVSLAEAFSGAGFTVLRCDLPFRQSRAFGPPRPGDAQRDQQGLQNAVAEMRKLVSGRVFLGGQSYGGRQATMLCAREPKLVNGLLLTSYPLHPPGKPQQLRVQHFPEIQVPMLFIEGTRDPFGTIEEMEQARKLIPAKTRIVHIEGAGHDLGFKGKSKPDKFSSIVLAAFEKFFALS